MDSDGCYRARVGGCTWNETRRFIDQSSARLLVQLESPCASDIVVVFHPDNGEVSLLIR